MKRITSAFVLVAIIFSATLSFAQKFGATPQDSVNCIINNSLYQEFYNQKNYKDAYEPWKKAVAICPQYHINLYIRGAVILKNMIASAKTPSDQEKYLNELMALYDTRSKAFGEEGTNIARKAKDLTDYRPNEKERIYKLYKEAADKAGNDLDDQFKPLYLGATLEYLKHIKADNEQMSILFDVYDYAADALEHSLKNAKASADQKTIDKVQNYIAMIEQVIEPFASCDKIIPIYTPKFEKNPQDLELLRKITTALERKNCTSTELFFKATENLHKIEPTAKSAFMMGQMLMAKNKDSEAASYFKEAIDKFDDNDSKSKASMLMGQAFMNAGQYSSARSAFYKAADYDPTLKGKSLLMVANMCLKSSSSCSSHDGKIRGAAWVAYDKAAAAKAADPTLADDADKLMSAARGQWPTQEAAFFYSIMNGQSFTVGCWIGESTTVRLR